MVAFEVPVGVDVVMHVFNDEYALVCRTLLRDCPIIDAMLAKMDAKIETEAARAGQRNPTMTDQQLRDVIDTCEHNRARMALVRQELDKLVQQVSANPSKVEAALLW